MALRNLLVRVGADITGLRAGLRNAQRDVQYFGRNVTGSMKEMKGAIGKTLAVLGSGAYLGAGIQDAMRYEALMTTLGESMGASRKDFEKWMETTGQAFGYSRIQAANTANILSLNFKKIATSQADLVAKTTKMMEVAGVIANKRGMTMEEVSDRIRSAMNQEADGADELGVNVRAAALMQTQAYKELGNNQPFDKLSEATRKTILYNAILEQVTQNLGATMQDTTAARMGAFTAALADVRMALGQAFLPILYRVLPLLTMMANALFKLLQVIAGFMRSLFGGGFKYKAPVQQADVKTTVAQGDALKGVGDAADKAGKKSAKAAKKSKEAWSGTFGFDEVNTIDDKAGADAGAGAGDGGLGGGGGGMGGLPAIEAPPMDLNPFEQGIDAMAKMFDKYTKPIKDLAKQVWTAISDFARIEFAKISIWWKENGDQIIKGFQTVWNVLKPIITWLVQFIWESIKGLIDGIITFFQGITEFFTGVMTGDWEMAWQGLKDIVWGAVEAIWNFFNLTLVGGIKKLLLGFVKDGVLYFKVFADDAVVAVEKLWTNIWNGIKSAASNFSQMTSNFRLWVADAVLKMSMKFLDFVSAVAKAGKDAWGALKSAFGTAADWFARSVITPIVNKFQQIKDAFHEGLSAGLHAVVNSIRAPLNDMIDALNGVKNAIPGIKNLPNIPHIPRLAQGGITNGPTLAVVGDNRGGQEVISPLDRLQGIIANTISAVLQMNGVTGGRNTGGDIILNIDGRAFARLVKPFLEREENRTGKDIRIRTI
jgi:phage-related protein